MTRAAAARDVPAPEPAAESRPHRSRMADTSPPDAGLLPSLGRLARGLTILFWALPLSVVADVQAARTSLLGSLGALPPLVANAAVLYALLLMGGFRPQERVWIRSLDRARILALANLGLSPFLHWWRLLPEVVHYQVAVAVMATTTLGILAIGNRLLQRLSAMLPDSTLRLEASLFTHLNLGLLGGFFVLATGLALWLTHGSPAVLATPPARLLIHFGSATLLLLFLLPLALTMTLIWKVKETILRSVFESPRPPA